MLQSKIQSTKFDCGHRIEQGTNWILEESHRNYLNQKLFINQRESERIKENKGR